MGIRKYFSIMMPSGIGTLYECHQREMDVVVLRVPFAMVEEHNEQALKNHKQSVAMLQSRMGGSACEVVAILEDRPWEQMPVRAAHRKLMKHVIEWEAKQAEKDKANYVD